MNLITKARRLVRKLNANHTLIMNERWLKTPPTRVVLLVARTGVSKQAIYHADNKIAAALRPETRDTAETLLDRLMGPDRARSLATDAVFEQALRELVPGDDRPARLARRAVELESGLRHVGRMRIAGTHAHLGDNIAKLAHPHADYAGVVTDSRALRDALPDDSWREQWPWFTVAAGMSQMNGYWVTRRTLHTAVRTTLLAAGRPLTAQEIGDRTGLPTRRVRSALHNRDYARRDAERWTLARLVAEPYTSSTNLIKTAIRSAGGEIDLAELIVRLRRWNIAESTIRNTCRTIRFKCRGAKIALRDIRTVKSGRLERVVHGRDKRGRPYWTFPATRRYLDGYSVTYMPSAIARALGCEPYQHAEIEVTHAGGSSTASVCWTPTNNNNASFGRIRGPLRAIGAEPGRRVRIALNEDRTIEMSIDDPENGVETEKGRRVRISWEARNGRRTSTPPRPAEAPRRDLNPAA